MIVVRTPVRISFLGGGTDYPEHYLKYGGQTLGAAINRYSYVTVNALTHLTPRTIRVGYSQTEQVEGVDAVRHPAVRECLRFTGIAGGVEIHYIGDLPARSGLGSSSSFTVALLHALHAYRGEAPDWRQLAEEAVEVERDWIKERVGIQDQYICAHGDLVHLVASADAITVNHPLVHSARLSNLHGHLLLLDTGIRRVAHEVLETQVRQTSAGMLTRDLGLMSGLVDRGVELLCGNRPIEEFGELLRSAWMVKRRLSDKITTSAIDDLYLTALGSGAIGGKLLGAGGGGVMLLFVPPDRRADVLQALPQYKEIPFGFDYWGSTVVIR